MDPEQTFIRVQERFSQMLTPRVRASLEYIYLFVAITLFCILVVMHANYVQQVLVGVFFFNLFFYLIYLLFVGFVGKVCCFSNLRLLRL